MKFGQLLFLVPVAMVGLTSCQEARDYRDHLDDYIHSMQYRDGFHILQLTDIHWSYNTSTQSSKSYVAKVLAEAARHVDKIDLVEITGDLFMLANTYHVNQFLDFFEEAAEQYGFKYAVIWGNHDHHGLYNPNWLSERFSSAKNCIHIDLEDNLYGRSNFMINLTGDGTKNSLVKWQIANLDSGASFSESAVSPFRDYDYIRKDQTDWWVKEHAKAGEEVPGIAYYHIPQDENLAAWNDIHEKGATYKNKFFKLEGFGDNGSEQYASDFLDVASQHNLKAAFMGHAHNNDWTVEYLGVTIGLGVKTGTELYFAHIDASAVEGAMREGLDSVGINENFDLIGASLVTLKDASGSFDLEHLYYNERANGDFIRWVRW